MIEKTTHILTNTNKALGLLQKENLQSKDPNLNKSQFSQINTTPENSKQLLNNIINSFANQSASKAELLKLLQQSPQFQSFGSLGKDLTGLITLLKSETSFESLIKELNIFNIQFSKITKANIEQLLNNNLRDVLQLIEKSLQNNNLKSSQPIQGLVDKILLQLDFSELQSYVQNGNFVYLPYLWDYLEKGSIYFKKNDNDYIFCHINLEFETLGKLDIKLLLEDNKKLKITMVSQKEILEEKLKENLSELKKAISSKGLKIEQFFLITKEDIDNNPYNFEGKYL